MKAKQSAALAAIRQACCLGLPSRVFMPMVAAQLRAEIPSACCQFAWSSEAGRISNFCSDSFMPRRLAWIILHHKRYEAGAGVGVRLSRLPARCGGAGRAGAHRRVDRCRRVAAQVRTTEADLLSPASNSVLATPAVCSFIALREHTIMKSLKTLKLAVATAALLAAGAASAERPERLAGTTWTLQADRTVLQLVINTQFGSGAPGQATCQRFDGTINTTPDIEVRGWYCPASGRIHFIHRHLRTHDAMRVFTGNVSDEVIGQPTYMAGTMTVLEIAFGDLGEYNFAATRQ